MTFDIFLGILWALDSIACLLMVYFSIKKSSILSAAFYGAMFCATAPASVLFFLGMQVYGHGFVLFGVFPVVLIGLFHKFIFKK